MTASVCAWVLCRSWCTFQHIRYVFLGIWATTGNASSLYEQGITKHVLLEIVVYDNTEAAGHISLSSSFWPNSQQAKSLQKSALNIIDNSCMIERKILELLDVVR